MINYFVAISRIELPIPLLHCNINQPILSDRQILKYVNITKIIDSHLRLVALETCVSR